VRLRRQGWQPVSAAIQSVFDELRARIQASPATRVVLSTLVRVPSVVGHLKPVVLLPMSAVTGLSEQQLRAILAHELAHVRRYDYAGNILQTVIETVLFYHPAIWWVSRVVRDEREHCCDDVALAVGCPASELARALITVDAARDNTARPEFENILVTAADGGNLLRRIRRIAKVRGDDGASRRSWVAGISVLVALVATSLVVLPRSTVASDNETVVATQSEEILIEGDNAASADDAAAPQLNAVDEADTVKQAAPQAAPQDVPLPVEKFPSFAKFPPSGSGLRVKLDERRWVEFNALASVDKVGGNDPKIFWRANGELINPPDGFDPLTLVPDKVDGRMSDVQRELLIQAVGPQGMNFSLSCSGGAAYGNFKVPIDDEFEQAPINSVLNRVQSNHTYAELQLTKEAWQDLSLQSGDGFQFVNEEDLPSVFVVSTDASEFAWKLDIQFAGKEQQSVGPLMVTDLNSQFGVPEGLRDKVRDELQSAEVVVFYFDKDKPLPKFLTLRRSRYDTVRFDNLSVFPGPRSAVRVSVNGVPVPTEGAPEVAAAIQEAASPPPKPAEDTAAKDSEQKKTPPLVESILQEGKVVDTEGKPVPDCWVGMFVEPLIFNEGMSPRTAFDDGPQLTHQMTTNADGTFSILAKKERRNFEGSFWAVSSDGVSGNLRMMTSWSYLQKNLTIKLDDAIAAVQVVDPNDRPVAHAHVVLEAVQYPRSVADRLPAEVRDRQTHTTMPTVAPRSVAGRQPPCEESS